MVSDEEGCVVAAGAGGGVAGGGAEEPRAAAGVRQALSSLRSSPGFRLLWISNLFFYGGAWTQTLVLGWLVFDTTRSEFLLAVFTAVRLAPMLLGPFAGVLSDRYDRVRLLMSACLWALGAVVAVAVMASSGPVSYGALVAGDWPSVWRSRRRSRRAVRSSSISSDGRTSATPMR